MKTILIICGVLVLLLAAVLYSHKKAERDVYYKGNKILVEIFNLDCQPNGKKGRKRSSFDFDYGGKTHTKMIPFGTCQEMKNGDQILLLTDGKSIFIHPYENPAQQLGMVYCFFFLGGTFIISVFFVKKQ